MDNRSPSAHAQPWPRKFVHKKCAVCTTYFEGELDGEYLCPECRAKGIAVQHQPDSLDTALPRRSAKTNAA